MKPKSYIAIFPVSAMTALEISDLRVLRVTFCVSKDLGATDFVSACQSAAQEWADETDAGKAQYFKGNSIDLDHILSTIPANGHIDGNTPLGKALQRHGLLRIETLWTGHVADSPDLGENLVEAPELAAPSPAADATEA